MNFTDLTLIPPLLRAVADAGYKTPSPIQQKAIPPVLAGRDLLGCAQTGTGKTAAFALPILQLLTARAPAGGRHKKMIRSLILTPTRELALQIEESFRLYGKYLPLRTTVIFGGVGQGPQVAQLQKGVDILVATPGRLNDLIGQGYVKLEAVEIFVLDEADRMLDMGFVQDVKKVLKFMPEKKQTLLFSATMPDEIVQLANSLLNKPAKVFVTPVSSTVERIDQSVLRVDKANKRRLLAHLLKTGEVDSALVFTRTKHGADRVVRELGREGIKAVAIHGNKSQNARQDALARFKDGRVKVMVATDIAARGLDINELSHVFNYDLPNVPETYVHRIGRTGRAGHGGTAVSFCCYDELEDLAAIEKLIGFPVPETTGHPWPMEVFEKAPKVQRGARPAGQAGGGKGEAAKKAAPKPPASKGKQAQPAAAAKAPAAQPLPVVEKAPASPRAGRAETAAQMQKKEQTAAGRQSPPAQRRGRKKGPLPPYDPYENLTGGKAIVTKKPVWGDATAPQPAGAGPLKGEDDMSRNNRRRGGKKRTGQKNGPKPETDAKQTKPARNEKKSPDIPKNENGIFDFSEAELAQDDSLKVISRDNSGTKYASFEDYLKDHES